MASLDKEDEIYYNKYFDLFRTEGWEQLIGELEVNIVGIDSIKATKDDNDLWFRKGQLAVLQFLIDFESAVNHSYEEAVTDAESI